MSRHTDVPSEEMGAKTRNLWVLVYQAPDVPGQWVGHCLDNDIVSVGNSPQHAVQMITEAVLACVGDDLANGRDPFARPKAPPEDWAELSRIQSEGTIAQGVLPPNEQIEDCVMALQLMVFFHVPDARHPVPEAKPAPVRWGLHKSPSPQPHV